MKVYSLAILACACFLAIPKWGTDFKVASHQAQQEHKLILLNFSGSDWCGPCIRMEKEIFDQTAFQDFSDKSLVLVKADFPRLKKNRLSKELEQANDALASRYNQQGIFPLTILLDPQGKVLKSWEGLPKLSAEEFVKEIDAVYARGNK